MSCWTCSNLSVNYVNDDKVAKAVHNVSFQLHEGELVGLVGESGCGKTTLMMALMRLLPAAGQIANGHINFRGQDLATLSEDELQETALERHLDHLSGRHECAQPRPHSG